MLFCEWRIKIFIIQITQVIETSGGSWLQRSSDSLHHKDYPTKWQDLHSKMFSIDFKSQNTIHQHGQHTDVNRFNMIQGPITACHFKGVTVRISLRNNKQLSQTTFQQIILDRTKFKLGKSRCKQREYLQVGAKVNGLNCYNTPRDVKKIRTDTAKWLSVTSEREKD